ncbi:MAG: type III secretion system protein [Mailhella sp.]|nr:type III secretion system protein [Mailhella sp.]
MPIEGINISQADFAVLTAFADQVKKTFSENGMPDAGSSSVNTVLEQAGLPVLPAPLGGLSLDTLMQSLGDEVRRQACKDGVDSLEAKAKDQKEVNQKELEEIAKRLEKMRSKSILDGFLKAFQIIGTIVGAIASVASIAAGVLTGNPLLVTAGVLGIVATADSITSMASGGKYSIAAGFTELGKKMGMSDETAKWFGFGMNIAVMVVSIGVSFGAGFASSAASVAKATENATKTLETAIKITTTASKISNVASGVNSVGMGSVTIANAVVDYQISKSQANSKELEAILERIRMSIEMEQDLIEQEMARANEVLAGVEEIVENCNQAQTAILNTNPSMA